MSSLRLKLAMLDNKHKAELGQRKQPKNLRVFYGWAKVGKIRKKEAISVIFENEKQREEKTLRAVAKFQHTVYVRQQTDAELQDAIGSTRMFSEYSIFLTEKRLQGSLELALKVNSDADKNHVPADERIKIADALRSHFLENHPDYKEPITQQEIEF